MKKLFILITLGFLIVGCGDKTIDASSNESLKKSIAAAEEDLTADKKEEFAEAVQIIAFSGIPNIMDLANTDSLMRNVKGKLHGKTVQEVIDESKKILAEREAQETTQEGLSLKPFMKCESGKCG